MSNKRRVNTRKRLIDYLYQSLCIFIKNIL
nr:MAG TPA: hypothetical protein [Caudoviricetes sp.]DAV01751.1 MAG TPA: hypothetical protein [Caudoviricetes sp.]